MDDEKYQKLRDYALKLLSFRPRSVKEIKGKLMQFSLKRGISAKIVDQVLEKLKSDNLINDYEFVRWWVDQRQTFKPKGTRAIRLELRQKGIDKEVIDEVFSQTKDTVSEFDLARKVIDKKIFSYRHLTTQELKIKASGLLIRRGFTWETIHKVIDSLEQKA